MAKVNEATIIEIRLGSVVTGTASFAVLLVLGFWTINYFSTTALQAQLSETRVSIEGLIRSTAETSTQVKFFGGMDGDVNKLTRQLDLLSSNFSDSVAQVAMVSQGMTELSGQLEKSVARQEAFEQFVISRMPEAGFTTPSKWALTEKPIIDAIREGQSPLDAWAYFRDGDEIIEDGIIEPEP